VINLRWLSEKTVNLLIKNLAYVSYGRVSQKYDKYFSESSLIGHVTVGEWRQWRKGDFFDTHNIKL
jgi:hypothetical protein